MKDSQYKYYMTMGHYPINDELSKKLPMHSGFNGEVVLFVDISKKRWTETCTFSGHEEFLEWAYEHPDGHSVISVDKIEEL